MKRFLLVLMTAILFLSLVSCSEEKGEKTEEKEEVKVDFFAEGIAEYQKGNYGTAVESFTQKIEEAPRLCTRIHAQRGVLPCKGDGRRHSRPCQSGF